MDLTASSKRIPVARSLKMLAVFLSIFFFIPIFMTVVGLGASWTLALTVHGSWLALLFICGLLIKGTSGEKVAWPLIFGMFFTIPLTCAVVFLLMTIGAR